MERGWETARRSSTDLRIVRHEIPARSGPPLGDLYAAFDPLTKARRVEN